MNFILKFSTSILTEKLQSHFFTVTQTLNSDNTNQQRSATLECFLQMLTAVRVRAFFFCCSCNHVSAKIPDAPRNVANCCSGTEFLKYLKVHEFYWILNVQVLNSQSMVSGSGTVGNTVERKRERWAGFYKNKYERWAEISPFSLRSRALFTADSHNFHGRDHCFEVAAV